MPTDVLQAIHTILKYQEEIARNKTGGPHKQALARYTNSDGEDSDGDRVQLAPLSAAARTGGSASSSSARVPLTAVQDDSGSEHSGDDVRVPIDNTAASAAASAAAF